MSIQQGLITGVSWLRPQGISAIETRLLQNETKVVLLLDLRSSNLNILRLNNNTTIPNNSVAPELKTHMQILFW